ncbi:MAG: endonuclease III domain-containing protein [Candidatus Deferrimicrobiaceae bacterium]
MRGPSPKARGRQYRGAGRGGEELAPRLADISRRLRRRFGRPSRCVHGEEPVRNLILTILSQNTNDANRDRAFSSLMRRFPTFSLLATATPGKVEEAIRTGGLAKAKAKAILSALARLKRERGDFTLEFLREKPLPEARAYLTSLPGVGVKTANIVLLFSFGLEAFPVDTHILRVAGRLGLVPASADLARAALLLEPHIPKGEQALLHLTMIRLGREICRPRNPLHAECPLLDVCPEGLRETRKRGRA